MDAQIYGRQTEFDFRREMLEILVNVLNGSDVWGSREGSGLEVEFQGAVS